jgi:paired amphipathic helix protein Sin3a
MITFQLLSKDGSSLDDAEVLSGRWQAYVEGFVSETETPGVPTSKVRRPFLRRSVTHPSYHHLYIYILTIANRSLPASALATTTGAGAGTRPDFFARGGLEIKVCVRTYLLFYVSRTEDVLWRVPSSAESERASERLAGRDAARTRWLEKLSFGRPGPAGGVVAAVAAAASSSEAAVVEQQ